MKIAIIGHTGLLGSVLYSEFSKEHNIIGMSRSTGYDLKKNLQDIIDECKSCDIVFNNAHAGTMQGNIIIGLADYNVKLITSGSMAADFTWNQYCNEKRIIENIFKKFKPKYQNQCLLLKMGYLEGYPQINQELVPIPISTILNSVKYWIENTRITVIEFDNIKK
jgi:hypothetical protein